MCRAFSPLKVWSWAVCAAAAPGVGYAAQTPATPETLTVVAATPLAGTGVDILKTPGGVQIFASDDLSRAGSANLTGALIDQSAAVNVNDNLDDPSQPDISYRGFTASPVLGTPQGLAVYQNGVRLNEAFGETVNWDLIPDNAVHRLTLVSANPVFGLNALGGAVALEMKNGFNASGTEAEASGGSFGRRSAAVAFGAHGGTIGLFVAARALDADGWRAASPDSLRQIYVDLGARKGAWTVDFTVSGARNTLSGQGAAPVQELALDRSAIFTHPQVNANHLTFVTLNVAYAASPRLSIQSDIYVRRFSQAAANGNTTSYIPCAAGIDLGDLCQADGVTPVAGSGGGPIPDISRGGAQPIGENDRQTITSISVGGAIQASSSADLLGRENRLAAGVVLDHAATDYGSSAEVGVIDAGLAVLSSGYVAHVDEGSAFNATPVSLHAATSDIGLFATDTFNLTSRLAVTGSGRYNRIRIDLADREGNALDGIARYARFNPALGATYAFGDGLSVYVGYAEGSRAPSPSEIECSDPARPCLLPSSLASDPPTLRQVVSHAWEAGLRGRRGAFTWTLAAFTTRLDNDIYAVATSLGGGYFTNVGATRRRGLEAGVRYRRGGFSAFADYSLVDATFRSGFVIPSPANPYADANGDIQVRPGNRLPGIPRHRIKAGADFEIRRGWTAGGSIAWLGDQVYRGDESNRLAPLSGYAVVSLHAALALTHALAAFVTVENVLGARYATFGVLGDPSGVGAPGVPASGADPRFQSPAAPVAAYGGLKLRF